MCAQFSKTVYEKPREIFPFRFYAAAIQTDRLVPGIDNVRFDVHLSPKFLQFCRGFVLELIVKHSDASELLHKSPGPPKPAEKKQFKEQLQDLLIAALNRANAEKNPQLETLVQGAIFKFLILEVQSQFARVISEGREKLKLFQRPGQEQNPRGYQLQEQVSNFQTNKKLLFRRVGQELLELIQELREDVIRKTREALLGSDSSEPQAIFSNSLIFTEDGVNDYVNLEKYVMLGNYDRDPDRFEVMDQYVRGFLEWADSGSAESQAFHSRQEAVAEINIQLDALRKRQEEPAAKRSFFSRSARPVDPAPPEALEEKIAELEARLTEQIELFRPIAEAYAARLGEIESVPDNATMLVDFVQTEQQIAIAERVGDDPAQTESLRKKAATQLQALERLHLQFQEAGMASYILAAYETAKIYQDLCPPINVQQLKEALVDAEARKKVLHLIEQYRLPASTVETVERSSRWVRDAGEYETRTTLIRFFRDYMRYQQDLRNFRLMQQFLDQIHFPLDAKQMELSEINGTLYQFLLTEEEKQPKEWKVVSHVILKADIRDSTLITAELFSRGLNPASYFSLNFFAPIQKLMPKYEASKVFLEGDAIIMSILERGGDLQKANSVARACCLAKDMVEGVRGVNDRAAQKNLPLLELGIGISHQASGPMYLMDGERPIMISKALNESDRLSGCGKLAKQILTKRNRFFSVFVMQILPNDGTASNSEEFLLQYNVEGIKINDLAFGKVCQEMSMRKLDLTLPLFGAPEPVELFCGTVPVGQLFQKLVIRRGRVPLLDPKDFHVVEYTDRLYYEVCSKQTIYNYVSKQLGWDKPAV